MPAMWYDDEEEWDWENLEIKGDINDERITKLRYLMDDVRKGKIKVFQGFGAGLYSIIEVDPFEKLAGKPMHEYYYSTGGSLGIGRTPIDLLTFELKEQNLFWERKDNPNP